jgi:hypothetical protein
MKKTSKKMHLIPKVLEIECGTESACVEASFIDQLGQE